MELDHTKKIGSCFTLQTNAGKDVWTMLKAQEYIYI